MPSLFAQSVANRHDQIAAKIIRRLAARVLDPVVASSVSERPIFEPPIVILNRLSADFSAEKFIQGLCLVRAAGKDYGRSIVFRRIVANGIHNAVAHPC
jgi:tetrahydromethanopterin S-methyltransferase subunit C